MTSKIPDIIWKKLKVKCSQLFCKRNFDGLFVRTQLSTKAFAMVYVTTFGKKTVFTNLKN